jgi:hypothetical protein
MKKSILTALVVLSATGLLLSCQPPLAEAGDAARAVSGPVMPGPTPVRVTVATDKPAYVPGQTVVMTLTAENMGSSPAKLVFPSTQRFDFAVAYCGKELWRWSAGRSFAPITGSVVIPPGGSLTYRVTEYRAQVPPPGVNAVLYRFDLTGTLTSTPAISGMTRFEVKPAQ